MLKLQHRQPLLLLLLLLLMVMVLPGIQGHSQ
jgi:hypothetical protein